MLQTDRHSNRISFATGVLVICWAQNALRSSKSRGYAETACAHGHRLVHVAAARAVQPPERALDIAAARSRVDVPPTLGPVLLDAQAPRAAARAHRPLRAQPDRHDTTAAPPNANILDRRSRKPEHPVECRRISSSLVDR
jgi:hypothetical protein